METHFGLLSMSHTNLPQTYKMKDDPCVSSGMEGNITLIAQIIKSKIQVLAFPDLLLLYAVFHSHTTVANFK